MVCSQFSDPKSFVFSKALNMSLLEKGVQIHLYTLYNGKLMAEKPSRNIIKPEQAALEHI